MNKITKWSGMTILLLISLFTFGGCSKDTVVLETDVNDILSQHTKEFDKNVYQVTDNVWVAVGFGLANSIMIEGDDGLIIVDTMETSEEAAEVLAEFRKISTKPVSAIIYTHNHTDHIMGAQVMADGADVDIYAHELLDELFQRIASKMRPIVGSRSMRMFGSYLGPDELVNSGIGPFLGVGEGSTMGYMQPTVTFADKLEVTIEGVRMELIHAPGETDDQIYVHLSDQSVLLCGDNYYKSFPNLYTIRGTAFRSLEQWYKSIDIIRRIRPEYLVPSHSRPVVGEEEVYEITTNYRDAIQYVHDQGIRAINSGLTPDEIVEKISLPSHLAELPYLQEFYGKVSWSLRSLFTGNLGWFSGDSADLSPISRSENDEMLKDLSGGFDNLMDKTKDYAAKGDYQTVLQLSGSMMRLRPNQKEAVSLRIEALTILGGREQNANARNYYLTEAHELLSGESVTEKVAITPELLSQIPIESIVKMLPVGLVAEKTLDMEKSAVIHFTDVDETYSIIIRKGVAEVCTGECENPTIIVEADSIAFISMLVKIRNPLLVLSEFKYDKGNAVGFGAFLKNFEIQSSKIAAMNVES
jgi:linear primary-alkylsulfatase